MKIKPEDYEHIRKTFQEFEDANVEQCKAHKAAHNEMRYAWDIVHAAKLTPFICDVIYKYANDDHIGTALRKILASRDF